MEDKDFDFVGFASDLSKVRQINKEKHPDIFAEIDKEIAEEEAETSRLIKNGILRSTLCDPFDIMRFAKKLKAKEAAEKIKSDKEKDER